MLKIIDNIQLSISNIHIRFEDTIRNEFAWGFTVKSIEAFTCNSEWKKQFYDRNLKENVNKLLKTLENSSTAKTTITCQYWGLLELE